MMARVVYTKWFLGPHAARTFCLGPWSVILMNPAYKGDKGLMEHELVHVKQCREGGLMHGLRMRFSKAYRFKCEVEAYKAQLKWSGTIGRFAHYLATRYNLDVTYDQAFKALRR